MAMIATFASLEPLGSSHLTFCIQLTERKLFQHADELSQACMRAFSCADVWALYKLIVIGLFVCCFMLSLFVLHGKHFCSDYLELDRMQITVKTAWKQILTWNGKWDQQLQCLATSKQQPLHMMKMGSLHIESSLLTMDQDKHSMTIYSIIWINTWWFFGKIVNT